MTVQNANKRKRYHKYKRGQLAKVLVTNFQALILPLS